MKQLTITASLGVTESGFEVLSFEVFREDMNVHEYLDVLSKILGAEIGACTLIVAEELNLSKRKAFKAVRKACFNGMYSGLKTAIHDVPTTVTKE